MGDPGGAASLIFKEKTGKEPSRAGGMGEIKDLKGTYAEWPGLVLGVPSEPVLFCFCLFLSVSHLSPLLPTLVSTHEIIAPSPTFL